MCRDGQKSEHQEAGLLPEPCSSQRVRSLFLAMVGLIFNFLGTRWAGRSQALAAQTPLLSEICGAVEKGNSIELVNEMIHSSLKSWFNDWVSDRIDKRPVAVGV